MATAANSVPPARTSLVLISRTVARELHLRYGVGAGTIYFAIDVRRRRAGDSGTPASRLKNALDSRRQLYQCTHTIELRRTLAFPIWTSPSASPTASRFIARLSIRSSI